MLLLLAEAGPRKKQEAHYRLRVLLAAKREQLFAALSQILPNGQPGQLYFGKTVRHRASFDYLFEKASRVFSPSVDEEDPQFSMEQARQEFPSAGAGDFRQPAVTVLQQNGSRISGFAYEVEIFGQTRWIVRQSFALLALIPIWLYRGKQGYHSKGFQYFCYGFYPLHLLILGLWKLL